MVLLNGTQVHQLVAELLEDLMVLNIHECFAMPLCHQNSFHAEIYAIIKAMEIVVIGGSIQSNFGL